MREAKEKGYTEPDPRDDLSGMDVARKLLILGREMGWPLELTDIQLEDLLSEECKKAASIDAFFTVLQKMDAQFAEHKIKAEQEGKVLRSIACLENGTARVQLTAVAAENPFYNLAGSDNMIVFTTDHYNDTPLVIKGPGAGAEVTTAGVFADIIRIANYLI